MSNPRYPLVLLPTPCHRLDRASAILGIDLWIKRDDLTGFAGGGNKGRKLEYLIGQALADGVEVIVSCGALQSNFLRQLAAACSCAGIHAAAVVMEEPFEYGPAPFEGIGRENGNVRLDQLFGLEMVEIENDTWDHLFDEMERVASEFEDRGKKVMRIPVGGSAWQGAYAFAEAAEEVREFGFDEIIFASSSGSTQVGLAYAFAGSQTKITGIACDPEPELPNDFAKLAAELDSALGRSVGLQASDFHFDLGYVGDGYGIPSEAGDEALTWLARTEGILLDPVYSAKAFSAIIDRAKRGELPGMILFWHTGGVPALFADHPSGVN